MSDCRLGRGIEKIKRIMQLGKKNSYNLYSNSTRGDRGVCIAIKRDRNVEILEEIRETVFENYLLLRCRIDQKEILIGAVYGPNTNNVAFYRELIGRIEGFGIPTVVGGDWNTVLDDGRGAENLDLEDRDHIPQKENGRILREWLERGGYCEPFRRKYPMSNKMSYIPFRTRRRVGNAWVAENYGKSRLDFYIISEELMGEVESVFYGDRLSRDFDHLEAVLRLGRRKAAKETIYIRNDTLDRPEITEIGVLGALDCISNHLNRQSAELRASVGRLEALYVEKCNIRRGIELGLVDDLEAEGVRLARAQREWDWLIHRIGSIDEWAQEELSCSRSTFYEVLLNEYKNRIVALQGGLDRDNRYKRDWLVSKIRVYTELFGRGSEQSKQCEEDLLTYDSNRVREDTNKYMLFLKANNEKPTSKFCKLGRDCNTVDDIAQIQKPGGGIFETEEERAEHVRSFYVNLYKKKIDRVLEIESLFEMDEWEKIQRGGKEAK
jgi:exonuclease III